MNVFTEIADDVFFVGFHQIESKIHKTYQILVRPDVSEDSLLTLTQQILITYSGAVSKHSPPNSGEVRMDARKFVSSTDVGRSSAPSPTNAISQVKEKGERTVAQDKLYSPYLESINPSTSGTSLPWQVIRVYLGVNMDLQRCLVVCVQPSTAAAGINTVSNNSSEAVVVTKSGMPGVFLGIGTNTYSHAAQLAHNDPTEHASAPAPAATYISPVRKTFLDFCQNLAFELNTAMREESLTVDYMQSVPASLTGPMQGLHNHVFSIHSSGPASATRALDSLIDLAFIRDLHCATAQLMVSGRPCFCFASIYYVCCHISPFPTLIILLYVSLSC